jgi:hypothetical protein
MHLMLRRHPKDGDFFDQSPAISNPERLLAASAAPSFVILVHHFSHSRAVHGPPAPVLAVRDLLQPRWPALENLIRACISSSYACARRRIVGGLRRVHKRVRAIGVIIESNFAGRHWHPASGKL